jgi:hypothetical protein
VNTVPENSNTSSLSDARPALWFVAWLLGYAACVALLVVFKDIGFYDDAYFFKRMAVNALEHGQLAWNVDEGPIYACTSLLFQLLAIVVAAVAPAFYLATTRVLACLCVCATFGLLYAITRAWDRGLAALALCLIPSVLFTTLSGMETALTLCMLALLLWTLLGPRARALPWQLSPLIALAIYLVRPDAALLAFPLMLGIRSVEQQRAAVREAVLLAGGMVLILLACKLYFHTALPRPFYAKQAAFSPYDAAFLAGVHEYGFKRFLVYACLAVPFFLLALRKRDPINLVLLGAVSAHAAYHLLSTVDVMGNHARFYAPAIPLLSVAAARGIGCESKTNAREIHGAIALCSVAFYLYFRDGMLATPGEGMPLPDWDLSILLLLVVIAASLLPKLRRVAMVLALLVSMRFTVHDSQGPTALLDDDAYLTRHTTKGQVFRGLDTLRACFGEHIQLYHSEIGVPGLRFQHGEVTDLVGLASRDWLFRKRSFDSLCGRDKPEAIFLPHKAYAKLNREIAKGKCIKNYQRVVQKSASPLFVRKDLAERYLACAKARNDPWVQPSR